MEIVVGTRGMHTTYLDDKAISANGVQSQDRGALQYEAAANVDVDLYFETASHRAGCRTNGCSLKSHAFHRIFFIFFVF